jgi:hypothetical protein
VGGNPINWGEAAGVRRLFQGSIQRVWYFKYVAHNRFYYIILARVEQNSVAYSYRALRGRSHMGNLICHRPLFLLRESGRKRYLRIRDLGKAKGAKGARLTLFQFNLHLTIRALAFCPLHPRPATGLGLASMPTRSLDRIQKPGVTQRLILTQYQTDIPYGFGVERVAK